jgi:hypothetical protein
VSLSIYLLYFRTGFYVIILHRKSTDRQEDFVYFIYSQTSRSRARASKGGSYITEVGPAYPRDLLARAFLALPAPISTAPSHLASSLALDSSNTGVSDLTLLLCDIILYLIDLRAATARINYINIP